jgi:hypothetical protein
MPCTARSEPRPPEQLASIAKALYVILDVKLRVIEGEQAP